MSKEYIFDDSVVFDAVDEALANLDIDAKEKELSEDDFLMPDERELVNKGEYDEYNFEEDELEDDDYYSEDDV